MPRGLCMEEVPTQRLALVVAVLGRLGPYLLGCEIFFVSLYSALNRVKNCKLFINNILHHGRTDRTRTNTQKFAE